MSSHVVLGLSGDGDVQQTFVYVGFDHVACLVAAAKFAAQGYYRYRTSCCFFFFSAVHFDYVCLHC